MVLEQEHAEPVRERHPADVGQRERRHRAVTAAAEVAPVPAPEPVVTDEA